MTNNKSRFDVKQYVDELATLKEELAQNTLECKKLLKLASQMLEEVRASLKKNEIGYDGSGGGRVAVMRKFINLRQEGNVDEYVRRFEALKTSMSSSYGYLTEEYFINSFVSGLKEEIGHMVEMLAPLTLAQAVRMALKQEELLRAMERKGVWKKKSISNMVQRGKACLVYLLSPFLRFNFIMAFTISCIIIALDVYLRFDDDLKNS